MIKTTYQNWTVLCPDPVNKTQYICRCLCGEIRSINRRSLEIGESTQCKECWTKKFSRLNGFNPISNIYRRAKGGARARNIEFNVSKKYLLERLVKQNRKCALSGMDLYIDGTNANASVDRIDSTKGYIENNVQWVDKQVNISKWNIPEDRFIELCSKVVAYNKSA